MPERLKRIDSAFFNEHLGAISAAWWGAWEDSSWQELNRDDPEGEMSYLKDLVGNNGICYAWQERDGKIVGFLFATLNSPPEPKNDEEKIILKQIKDDNCPYVFAHELAVLPEYRGRRLGTKLMEKLIDDCRESGANRIVFWTEEGSRSRQFYERLGSKVIGRVTVDRSDLPSGKESRIWYQLDLAGIVGNMSCSVGRAPTPSGPLGFEAFFT